MSSAESSALPPSSFPSPAAPPLPLPSSSSSSSPPLSSPISVPSSSSSSSSSSSLLREAQVSAAVAFLQNPKVVNTPPSRKVLFLENKGLSAAEIAESLRRVNSASAEYRAVADGLLTGKTASEAILQANVDQHTQATHSTATTTSASPSTYSPSATAPSSPYSSSPYPPYSGGSAPLYSPYPPPSFPAPSSSGRDWGKVGLAAAAVVGLGTSAYLLAKPFLPSVRWEFPTSHPAPPPPPLIPAAGATSLPLTSSSAVPAVPALLPPTSQLSSSLPPSFTDQSGSVSGSSASAAGGVVGVDRLGVRVLVDDETTREERLLRGLGDVKAEMSDIAALLRDQNVDHKRTLVALQQAIEHAARERKEDAALMRTVMKSTAATATSSTAGGSSLPPSTVATGEWSAVNGRDSPTSSTSSTGSTSPSPRPASPYPPTTPLTNTNHGLTTPSTPLTSSSPSTAAAAPLVSSLSTPSVDISSGSVDGVEARVSAVRSALSLLQRSVGVDQAQSTLQALSLYLTNLSSNLQSTRYRKVLTSNSVYQSRVQAVPGAVDVLTAVGFSQRGSFMEWGNNEQDRDKDVAVLTEAKQLITQLHSTITTQKKEQLHSASTSPAPHSSTAAAPLSSPLPAAPTSPSAASLAAEGPTSRPHSPSSSHAQDTANSSSLADQATPS